MLAIIKELIDHFMILFLLMGLAIANLWRRRRETRARLLGVTVAYLGLAMVCTPAVGHLALGSLEWHYPPLERMPSDAEAMIVLSGNILYPDARRTRAELGESTLHRCLYAAMLYRQCRVRPLVVSGGRIGPPGGMPAAWVMRNFLVDVGVLESDVLMEDQSRTTYENAVECRRRLPGKGSRKVVLVTEATHMFRAVRCFRKQGFAVIPAPCHHRANPFDARPLDFVPSASAAVNLGAAMYEWLGTAWYCCRGRI
jgi:uncharacterized SAM-binding protein YcdF (DUF218 family)